jgi:hypothetical protein
VVAEGAAQGCARGCWDGGARAQGHAAVVTVAAGARVRDAGEDRLSPLGARFARAAQGSPTGGEDGGRAALGEIGSPEAVPALSEAFLARRVAPTNVVNEALRKIGGEAAPAFERGIVSTDPIVRVSSSFGLSGIAESHGGAVHRLAVVLAEDSDARVRTAAAAALGIVGGGNAPAELLAATADPDVQVRRSAMKALGSFDDPTAGETLRRAHRGRGQRGRIAGRRSAPGARPPTACGAGGTRAP